MPHPTPTTLFFAGTDTDVGKTYVASLVAASLHNQRQRVGVYKPVASDCQRIDGKLVASDAVALWEAAGRPLTLGDVCPQRFIAPLSPPAAAALEGKQVDARLLRSGADVWTDDVDTRIIEGAGGLLSPLAEGVLNIDLVKQFDSPKCVIHQVLATCDAAKHRGVTPAGIILCQTTSHIDESVASNRTEIERYCDVAVVGDVGFGDRTFGDLSQIA